MCPFPLWKGKGLDQRFPPLQEAAFKKDVEPKVVVAGMIASALFLLVLGSNTVGIAGDLSNPDLPLRFSPSDPRTWASLMKAFLACLGTVNLALCSLRLHFGWLAWWDWELQLLAIATLAMVCNAFHSRQWALLLGLKPEQVFTYNTLGDECNEMLTLDAFITGLCLFVPIRSCVLWVAPTSGLLMHLSMRAVTGTQSSTWYDVILLVILAFFSLVGAFTNERTARERFLAVCDVKWQDERLSSQCSAMSRILARFCDCVLELDADFRFSGAHRQFAAIVFSLTNTSLDGGSFLDHLASGQLDFVESVSKKTSSDEVSDMLPILLRDSLGREFAAQAYCTCYEDRKGRHYFIGITETQERMPQEAYLTPLVDLGRVGCSTVRKASFSGSSGSCVEEEAPAVGEISFTFLDDDHFSILRCSPGFTALGGPLSQEQPLSRWMRPQELQRFSRWAQQMGNIFRQHQSFKNLVLNPPHTQQADVEYVMKLSLSLLQMTDDSEMAFQVLVEEVHQRRRRRRDRRGSNEGRVLFSRDIEPAVSCKGAHAMSL